MITYINLRNFKCHENLELDELRPISIITGPNNSGKSAVLQALQFLSIWTRTNSSEFVKDHPYLHSFDDMVYQKNPENIVTIGLGINGKLFSKKELSLLNDLNIGLTAKESFNPLIWRFSFNRNFNINVAPQEIFSLQNEKKKSYLIVLSEDKEFKSVEDLNLPVFHGRSSFPFYLEPMLRNQKLEKLKKVVEPKFIQYMKSIRVISPKRGLEVWNSPLLWESEYIEADGKNIATFIAHLFTKRSESFVKIEDWLRRLDPSIQEIRTDLIKERKKDATFLQRGLSMFSTLEIKEQDIYKHLLTGGSGLSAVLPIIAHIITSTPGDIILIEEPEIHLHHGAIEILLDLFIEAAEDGKQIILTTHSIDLLNSVYEAFRDDPEKEKLFVRYDLVKEKDSLKTKANRILPHHSYLIWSQGFKSILKERPT